MRKRLTQVNTACALARHRIVPFQGDPMKDSLPQVGAPDPELKNSPIIGEVEYDAEEVTPGLETEAPACYFNGQAFALGEYVRSGSEVLQCAERGVWVRKGEQRPD
jgi:hypothetical protein